jgi:hypothetical protein
MTITNPRYLAYCRAHGESDPEAMLERDREAWPGGCMTGFVLWIGEMKRGMAKTHPEAMFRGWNGAATDQIVDQAAFDKFLADQAGRVE